MNKKNYGRETKNERVNITKKKHLPEIENAGGFSLRQIRKHVGLNSRPTKRKCLSCEREFLAESEYIRLCQRCKN